ncbi:hypothetical protein RJZ56_003123 [Blastomyces dermatitidis]
MTVNLNDSSSSSTPSSRKCGRLMSSKNKLKNITKSNEENSQKLITNLSMFITATVFFNVKFHLYKNFKVLIFIKKVKDSLSVDDIAVPQFYNQVINDPQKNE